MTQTINDLMEIASNATAGPWKKVREGYDHAVSSPYGLVAIAMEAIPGAAVGNAAFMAAFDPPTALRVLRMAKRLEEAQEAWKRLQDNGPDLPSFDLEPVEFQKRMDERRKAIFELGAALAPAVEVSPSKIVSLVPGGKIGMRPVTESFADLGPRQRPSFQHHSCDNICVTEGCENMPLTPESDA